MQIATTIAQARALFDVFAQPLGFVPTMGALHEGHLELVRRAKADCLSVAASLFVNPMQFGPGEDLAKYPRDFEGDREKLRAAGVDVLFAPDPAAMYPPGFSSYIDVGCDRLARTRARFVRITSAAWPPSSANCCTSSSPKYSTSDKKTRSRARFCARWFAISISRYASKSSRPYARATG